MKATVVQDGDVYIVHLSGCLDYEALDAFRVNCLRHFSERKVIFNLRDLSFVGSTGITPFVETMTELRAVNQRGLKFCGVSSEFRRIFAASAVADVEIYDTEMTAQKSFSDPTLAQALVPQSFLDDDAAE